MSLKDRIKKAKNRLIFIVLKGRMMILLKLRTPMRYVNNGLVSIIGIIYALWLYHPGVQETLKGIPNLDSLFIASGGLIGTILALVITLSFLPIQRASEVFTSSFIRLYRDDRVTQVIFMVLTIFCLFSFIMAVEDLVWLHAEKLLPLQLVIIAITLDLIRWHHRHVSRLLVPGEAVQRLLDEVKKYISNIQNVVTRTAKLSWNNLPPAEQAVQTLKQLESKLYAVTPDHPSALVNERTRELAEVALRATTRGESDTANRSIFALSDVACYYLNMRKDNLILMPKSMHTLGCDADSVLNPIYAHLDTINKKAVSLKDEATSIVVIKAFAEIATLTANLKSPAFEKYEAPITWMTLGYLKGCIDSAQRAGLVEVPFQGSTVLLDVVKSTPVNIQVEDIYRSIIEEWIKVATSFVASGKGDLSNDPLNYVMITLRKLLEEKHFELSLTLREVLDHFAGIIPLAILHEKAKGSLMHIPLEAVYSMAHPESLGIFVENAICLIKVEEKEEYRNPYSNFMEINEQIYQHFYEIGGKNADLSSSFLMWHMTQTIKHISQVYLNLLDNPVTTIDTHNKALADQVKSYLAFFWVTFSNATSIDKQRAEVACDTLSWVGLAYYNIGHHEVTESCMDNIASITDSFCRISQSYSPYVVADLLMPIWYIRMLAEKKEDKAFLCKIDGKLSKPATLNSDIWPHVQEAIEFRKGQLKDNLHSFHFLPLGRAVDLLRQLLWQSNKTSEDTPKQ